MGSLGITGFSVTSLSSYKTQIQTLFQTAFGSGIDLSEQSPQGNLINSLAEMFADNDLVGLDIFNNLDAEQSQGVMLDLIAILKGTQRNDGTAASLSVQLTSNATPYTINAGSVFPLSDTDYLFTNSSAINVSCGVQTASLLATTNAITGVEIGNKLTSQSYYPQLTDIEVLSFIEGTNDETDTALRARLKSLETINSIGEVDSIYSALLNLDNVSKCNVFENDTSAVDSNGLPAHSIEAVVLGDTDLNVATTIFQRKSAGTVTYGNTTCAVEDTQGFNHNILFTRPSKVNIYVAASVTAKDEETLNPEHFSYIQTECQTYVAGLKNGQDVSYSSVFGIFAKYNDFDIVSLTLSSGVSPVSANIPVGIRQYASIDDATTDVVISAV